MKNIIFLLLISVSSQAQTLMGFNTFMGALPTASNLTGASFPILQGGASKMAPVSLFGSVLIANSPLSLSGNTISLTTPLSIVYGGTGTTTPGINAGTNISVSGSWPNQTISTTNYTASNGLTLSSGNFTLGGPLTGNTNISTSNYTIQFGGPNGTTNLNPQGAPHIFEIVNDNTTNQVIRISSYGSGSTLAGQNNFHFYRAEGTANSPTAVLSGDVFMSMGYRGNDGSVNTPSAAAYQVIATENWSTSGHGTKFRWETTLNGTAGARTSFMEFGNDGSLLLGPNTQTPSTILDLQSTTKAMAPPRMTSTQRDAIASPSEGLYVHNTTSHLLSFYNGSSWIDLNSGISGLTTGKLPYATSSTTIGDSEISRSGTGSYLIAGGSSTGKLSISSTGTSYIAQNLHTYSTPDMLEIGNTVSNAPINLTATGGVVMTNYPSATTNFPSDYGSYGLTINTDMTSNVTGYPLRLRGGSTVNTSAGFGNGISFESQVVSTFVQGNSIVSSLTSTGSGGSFDLIFGGLGNGISGEKLRITSQGNIYGISGSTSMSDGFFYIPSGSGAPSGTPTSISGRVPMYYDATNNNFYIYNGAWKKVALL